MTVHEAAAAAQQPSAADAAPMSIEEVRTEAARLIDAVGSVISGKSEAIRVALIALLSDGHLLIEDVPGVGKTKLARALAGAIDGTFKRVQFTPDLLPSDLSGVSVYDQERTEFVFKPGPVFAHIVVGDEINRASPKTQSALLEAMEEKQVTTDGSTYPLPHPFMVIATQNPIEMEGTFALPEAQRDRFLAQISMGYPSRQAEIEMLGNNDDQDPLDALRPAITIARVHAMIQAVRSVFVADGIRRYVVDLAEFTRRHAAVRLGASPRAALQLIRAAKAAAALAGRPYVLPDDVRELAPIVWSHRLLMSGRGQSGTHVAESVIAEALAAVPVPQPRQ